MTTSVNTTNFELTRFLEQRVHNPSFTMVEIGYGHTPVTSLQPHSFTGDQVYIGVEAGMRTKVAETTAQVMRQVHEPQNAFFMVHDIGEGMVYRPDMRSDDEEYRGDYHAETILPAAIADEVVASNVFCDPLIARSWGRTVTLLKEVSRLLAPTGVAVLRETITPWEVDAIGSVSLSRADLEVLHKTTPEEPNDWKRLESLYGMEIKSPPFPQSYYLFLGKTSID